MSACQTLARALRAERRWLLAERGIGDPVVTAMLRIEVTTDALRVLYRDANQFRFPSFGLPSLLTPMVALDQPLTFMGVSLYEVRHPIPAPGWRIINPMRRK